jgi:ATP-dependent DNA helicase DinG
MNHALFFALMAIQGTEERYIFENDFVIFDEAHTLEGVAGLGIGKRISRSQVLFAIHKLYNPKTRKGILARRKGSVQELCRTAESSATAFFESLHQAATSLSSSHYGTQQTREIRIRHACVVPNVLAGPLQELQTAVREVEERAKDEAEMNELASARRSLWEAQTLVDEFLEQPEADFTYWMEVAGRRGENIALCASPSDIAERIGPTLFRAGSSVIMTSATLSVDGKLDYFQRRMGAETVPGIILDSPFDHGRQMKLCLARGIPEPDTRDFEKALPRWIMQSIERSGGKALVLFTSAALMRSVAAVLDMELRQAGIALLVQGAAQPRHALLEEFKRDIHSVLFGLESFWMGVDVPGEALEHVIITRLPFAVPNHPLIEARLESIAHRGGNSFMEYTLPEAVLKFRQGAGRLLRSRRDKGLVTILDSRILTKRYGRIFLSSLPPCPLEITNSKGEVEEVFPEDW